MVRPILLLFAVLIMFTGCDQPLPDTSSQDIGNAAWRSNSSLLTFAERKTTVSLGVFEYKLYEANSSGAIGNEVFGDITNENFPTMYLSEDGNVVVTVLAEKLIRKDLRTGAQRVLTTNVTRLYAVSPDLKYAFVTHAILGFQLKKVSVLDISGPTTRVVKEWESKGLTADQGYWLADGSIALTFDTTQNREYYVALYDTTGQETTSYFGASTPSASSDYEPSTHTLYVKNYGGGLDRIDIASGARTEILPTFTNIDVRGNVLAYVESDQSKHTLTLRNLTTGETRVVADDVFRFAFLSPELDKVAYVREVRQFFTELKVIGIQVP
jgi:hypothetical protein